MSLTTPNEAPASCSCSLISQLLQQSVGLTFLQCFVQRLRVTALDRLLYWHEAHHTFTAIWWSFTTIVSFLLLLFFFIILFLKVNKKCLTLQK